MGHERSIAVSRVYEKNRVTNLERYLRIVRRTPKSTIEDHIPAFVPITVFVVNYGTIQPISEPNLPSFVYYN